MNSTGKKARADLDKISDNQSHPPPSGDIEITSFTSFAALEEHASDWNRLVEKSPLMTPMMSAAWVISYLEHRLDTNDSWICLIAFENSILVGVMPLIIKPVSRAGIKTVRLLLPYRADAIACPGLENRVLPQLFDAAQKLFPQNCGIEIRALRDYFPSFAIYKSDAIIGKKIFIPSGHGLFFDCDHSLEKYQSQFSKNFSKNLSRLNNKLRQEKDREFRFIDQPEADDLNFDKFAELESSGWKGSVGKAISKDPCRENYYRALTQRLAHLGWLRWHFLEIDQKPVATQMAVKKGRILFVEKNGYDENYKALSPGTLLFEEMVKRGFEDTQTGEIDCLSDFGWMNKWGMNHRQYYDLFIYPKKLWPFLTGYLPRRLKSILKSGF